MVVAETETPSEAALEVPGDTTARARVPAVTAVRPAWGLEVEALEEEGVGAAAVEGADKQQKREHSRGSAYMKSTGRQEISSLGFWVVRVVTGGLLLVPALQSGQQSNTSTAKTTPAPAVSSAKTFDTPQQAADVLVAAAEEFDVRALVEIFGPDGDDIVLSGEYAQDRQRALNFAAEAHEKKTVSVDPKTGNRAFLLVGNEDWPFPVPIVKEGNKWHFDAKSGRQELFYRRIGSNELDAIDICHGYVEAQHSYALQPREGYDVNQYAQRIISTPGKQDGLAWQNPDGSWSGPIGEKIARAIEQGYSGKAEPYHGYFFKILKGQGPAAPLGEMNYVIKGTMIGGFALVAAPAEYGETGMKSFIVSQDGVVYQKDAGPASLNDFIKMERFNPDQTWTPVSDD